MNEKVQCTFLSNSRIHHRDGEQYLVLETCNRTNEMLVLRMTKDGKDLDKDDRIVYHYFNGVFTPCNLATARIDGSYFANGVIHNWHSSKATKEETE